MADEETTVAGDTAEANTTTTTTTMESRERLVTCTGTTTDTFGVGRGNYRVVKGMEAQYPEDVARYLVGKGHLVPAGVDALDALDLAIAEEERGNALVQVADLVSQIETLTQERDVAFQQRDDLQARVAELEAQVHHLNEELERRKEGPAEAAARLAEAGGEPQAVSAGGIAEPVPEADETTGDDGDTEPPEAEVTGPGESLSTEQSGGRKGSRKGK